MRVFRLTGLRLIRVFTILKMFSFVNQVRYIQLSFEIAGEAVRKSLGPLFPLFAAGAILVLFLSTLVYYCERGDHYDPEQKLWLDKNMQPSKFSSIPASVWFIVVTITTTGYGDMFPQTFWGRFLTFITMICGMLLIALPSIIIGRNFSILWGNLKARNQIPPVPIWLLKLTGGNNNTNYQKLGHEEDELKVDNFRPSTGNEEDDIESKIPMKSLPVLKTTTGEEDLEIAQQPPQNLPRAVKNEKQKNSVIAVHCPNCKHEFQEQLKGHLFTHQKHTRKHSKVHFEEDHNKEEMLLSPEITDMELLRLILIEVQKGTKLIKEMNDANNFDEKLLFQNTNDDED
jgi:hypothetical protein